MSYADPSNETREDIRDRILRVIAMELFRQGYTLGLTDKIRAVVEQGTVDCVRMGLRAKVLRDSDNETTNPYGEDHPLARLKKQG